MNKLMTPIDISNLPDLLHIAEEVQATKTPRLLKRESEPVVMLIPVGAAVKRSHPHKRTIWTHYDPQRVKAALKHSAGVLQGVNKEELLRDVASQRSQESTGRLF